MKRSLGDMTTGKPAGLILSFAIPLMIGNVFQQFYTIVDTMVVGQFVGVEALAALGAAEWLQFLVLGMITGATQGFSVLLAQRFGADDAKGVREALAMSILLGAVIAVAATALGLLALRPMLNLLHTPAQIMDDAQTYLRIVFGGIAAVMGYNVCAGTLRALGNSRTPLAAMVIAASINIVLDLVFVLGFHWGVAGAAAATVVAQACSCLVCLRAIREEPLLALEKEDWRPRRAVIRRLLCLATPTAFQNAVIAVGGMAVQFVVNGFGFIFVAGFTATNKLYGVLETAATSFGYSMATYSGQNLGAGKYLRIRQGMRSARWMAVATSAVIAGSMFLWGRQVLMLFISGEPAVTQQVSDVAYRYLCVMCAGLPILYLLHIHRSALQGMGDTVTPMLSGFAELAMRTTVVFFLPLLIGERGVYFAEIAAWSGAAVLLVAIYEMRIGRLTRQEKLKEAAQES